MNSKIIDSKELQEGDKVYLKKDNFSNCGWRIVYPYKDNEGKWLWKNIIYGGSQNLFWMLFTMLLVFGFMYVYHHDTSEMQKVVASPCEYCSYAVQEEVGFSSEGIKLNITAFGNKG